MSRVVRVGIIGLGGRGLSFARMYSRERHPGFELWALCDCDPKALEIARRACGDRVSYYGDMHEMLGDPQLDAVLVTTNDPHHVMPALAAMRVGKHVLVEKPLCQTIEDARMLVREARQAPGIFMIGFELRECTVFRQMKQLLASRCIGEVKVGHCFDNVSVGGDYYFHNPRRQRAFYKSLLLQKASHSLDLLNWFMGSQPVKVYGVGGLDFYGRKADPTLQCRDCSRAGQCPYWVDFSSFELDYGAIVQMPDYCVWSREMDLNDNSELCISYASGGKATFHECHFTPEYSREFWLVGTEGKMYGYYDNPGRFLIRIEHAHSDNRHTEELKPPRGRGSHGGGDERLRDEFYRRIVENDRPLQAIESAYYSTALAICAEESIQSGKPVAIPGPEEED